MIHSSWLRGSLLAAASSLVVLGLGSTTAQATERIILRYEAEVLTISLDELEEFAETGIVPEDLQNFFDITGQVPEEVSRYLAEEIRIPGFIEEFLESSTGEFVVLQLNNAIRGSGDLQSLESALNSAVADDEVSMLELLGEFPEEELEVDLKELEPIYNDVKNFVERVLPALEVARDFLEDVLCECEEDDQSALPSNPTTAAIAGENVSANPTCEPTDAMVDGAVVDTEALNSGDANMSIVTEDVE